MMTDTPAHPGLISLQGIGKSYQLAGQHLSILNDVCLSIASGDSCGILGASGSGKSTLLNILGLLDLPNCGQYHFAGHDIFNACLLYTSPSPRDRTRSRMPSSA